MTVKNRLDTLRRQAGAATEATQPAAPSGDVRRRLQRLRPERRGVDAAGPLPAAGRSDPEALARTLGAEVLADGVLRRDWHLGTASDSGGLPDPGAPFAFPGMPTDALGNLGYLDTETSGLAGGTGTIAFNIGLLSWDGGGWRVRQYLLTGFAGEGAMLAALAGDLDGLSGLVTYNGGSFDLPLLRDRYRLHGIASAPLPALQPDLLHPVRRLFRSRWPDCRLATAERQLLGTVREHDLPGSDVPAVWFEWLRRGSGRRMPAVLAHNRQDLVSLLRLLPALCAAVRAPDAWGAAALGAARAWLTGGDEGQARAVLETTAQRDAATGHELARLRRRAGDTAKAAAIWRELEAQGCPRAREQLAKYHEHVLRDPVTALALANGLPAGGRHDERRRRLERRAAGPTIPLNLEDDRDTP